MALTNKGFDGTVTEADFAIMQAISGPEGVESAAAWAVTQGTGRQVSVAAQSGWAKAPGVISKDTAPITESLGTPTNGQWYLIVRRVNWATDTVSVEAVAHSTTSTTVPTVPPTTYPTVSSTPGTEYDQFLAWAWVRSTDTTMVLFDLRQHDEWWTYSTPLFPEGGAFVSSAATVRWRYVNRHVFWNADGSLVDKGTGTGTAALPLPIMPAGAAVGAGREFGVTGNGLQSLVLGGELLMKLYQYNGGAFLTNGWNFIASGQYQT